MMNQQDAKRTAKLMNRNKMFLIFWIVIIISLIGCNLSHTSLENRLKKFYTFIDDEQLIDDFEQGQLTKVILAISNQIQSNDSMSAIVSNHTNHLTVRQQEFKILKQKEWIDFFSVEQTVNYYYNTFYLPMKKKKKKKLN